jgi:hypothetical protein
MRCDWILRNFRSECCCVLFLQFWTVEQDASSKKCDEMCCQDGLAFSIWDFTIKHIQISTSSILKRRIWWGLQWSLSTENSEFANRLLKLTLRVSVYIFKTHGFPGKKHMIYTFVLNIYVILQEGMTQWQADHCRIAPGILRCVFPLKTRLVSQKWRSSMSVTHLLFMIKYVWNMNPINYPICRNMKKCHMNH